MFEKTLKKQLLKKLEAAEEVTNFENLNVDKDSFKSGYANGYVSGFYSMKKWIVLAIFMFFASLIANFVFIFS